MIFKERTYSVLVASANGKFNGMIASLLPVNEFYPVAYSKSADEVRRILSHMHYDIVIINTPLPDDFGISLALDSNCASSSVLVFVKGDTYDETVAGVTEHGVLTLPKPTSTQLVTQTIRLMCATCEKLSGMEKKTLSLREKMEEIRIVNRAKWCLIDRVKMSEPEAHRYIEKQAMDLRTSKREVAETIIKTYE